jgi:hypothetical protein
MSGVLHKHGEIVTWKKTVAVKEDYTMSRGPAPYAENARVALE